MIFSIFIFNYIGPGLGGGVITAVLGFLASIFLALFAIIWYPVKKLIGKFRNKRNK
jgi:3-dehydroquinate synthetase